MNVKYTKEMLEKLVKSSVSISDIARKLNLKPNGGSNSYLSKKIKHFGIDTSHFSGQSWAKGKSLSNRRKSPDEVLVLKDKGLHRTSSRQLRNALLDIGRDYACEYEGCGINEWNGKKLVLEVDHIDGNCFNNLRSNLRFICPNCHSLTKTFKAKNIKNKRKNVKNYKKQANCKVCQIFIYTKNKTGLCSTCYHDSRRKM